MGFFGKEDFLASVLETLTGQSEEDLTSAEMELKKAYAHLQLVGCFRYVDCRLPNTPYLYCNYYQDTSSEALLTHQGFSA